jgi:hypothetical protein
MAAVAATGAGCHNGVISVSAPIGGGAHSVLMVLVESGEVRAVTASEFDPADVRILVGADASRIDSSCLYALFYRCPLSALTLSSGPQKVSTSGGVWSPPPTKMMASSCFANGTPSQWTPISTVPDAVSALRLERAAISSCPQFGVSTLELPNTAGCSATFGVSIDDERALVGTDRGSLFEVRMTGAKAITSISTTVAYAAGFRADDGRIWLAGPHRAFAQLDLDHGFLPAPPHPSADGIAGMWLDGASGGGSFELYLLSNTSTSTKTLERFDGASWSVIAQLPIGGPRTPGFSYYGGVAWAGPEHAFAVAGAPSLVEYDHGSVSAHDPTLAHIAVPGDLFLTSMAYTPELGAMAGTDNGGLVAYLEQWSGLAIGTTRAMTAMKKVDGTVAHGNAAGIVAYYFPSNDPCQPAVDTSYEVRALMPLRGGIIALNPQQGRDANAFVTVLQRTDPVGQCSF